MSSSGLVRLIEHPQHEAALLEVAFEGDYTSLACIAHDYARAAPRLAKQPVPPARAKPWRDHDRRNAVPVGKPGAGDIEVAKVN